MKAETHPKCQGVDATKLDSMQAQMRRIIELNNAAFNIQLNLAERISQAVPVDLSVLHNVVASLGQLYTGGE